MEALFFYLFRILTPLSILAIIGLIGFMAYTVIKQMIDSDFKKGAPEFSLKTAVASVKVYGIAAAIALGVTILSSILGSAFVEVPAGHRGIIFSTTKGVSERILGEGIRGITPVVETTFMYDVRTQQTDHEGAAATKDQQEVHTKISVWWSANPSKVNVIHQTIGPDYYSRIIPSNVDEIMKAEVAKHTALGLLSNREQVAADIRDNLKQKFAAYNIIVDNVAIGNFEFSEEFKGAIERKQMAEQDALRKSYELQAAQKEAEIARAQAKGRADAEVEQARGQAQAAKIIAQAIAGNPNYMELKKLETQQNIAKTLAEGKNVVYLPSNTLLNLPASK